MKSTITGIRLTPVAVPRHTGFVSRHVIVRISSSDGVNGVGEMSDFTHLPMYLPNLQDLEETIRSVIVGKRILDIGPINKAMSEAFPEAGFIYDMSQVIRSGVDMALYDLLGRTQGLPVHDLLGGKMRDKVKVCYPIFRHRDKAEIAPNLEFVRQRLAAGFDVIRLYVGGSVDLDDAFLAGLREQFGDRVTVKSIDFSNMIDWKSAIQYTKRLAPYGFTLVESPAIKNDFSGLAEVRRRIDHPVSEHCWSQHQVAEMVRHGSVDILNICPVFIGGITPAMQIHAVAQTAGLKTLIGTTQELSIGTAAQIQVGAAAPSIDYVCDPTGPWLYVDDVTEQRCRYEGGFLHLPEGNGLGVELDEEKLRELSSPLTWQTHSVTSVFDRAVGKGR